MNQRSQAPSPISQFYIIYKIHKKQGEDGSWPTRPVCSDVTSYPHILGKWVMEQLQPVAQCQPSYFKDTFELKKMLDDIELPPNARLFTADAVSMYTNIKTEPALLEILGGEMVQWPKYFYPLILMKIGGWIKYD
jgi:hypothetical protein